MANASQLRRPSTPSQARGPLASSKALWWSSPFAVAMLGNVLLWASLPPVSWGWLAWIAPVPWLLLVRRRELVGRRPYGQLWLASALFWLAALHWLTLPHWATTFGLIAISAYLAIYFPLFIGLCRLAVHRLRVSMIVTAPVVYVGLEFARAHLLSGFSMASIAHSQIRWPVLLQISDLAGVYTVSFVLLLVAAAIAQAVPYQGQRANWLAVVPAVVVLVATLSYGVWRLGEQTTVPGPKVALIQGSIDIEMKHDPEQRQRIYDQYVLLSRKAVVENADLDLIAWPETMMTAPWYLHEPGLTKSTLNDASPEDLSQVSRQLVEATVQSFGTPCLFGIDTWHDSAAGMQRFNSGLFTDRDGHALGRYDKCHLVAFGEFVPLADKFPWLYRLSPLPNGLNAGQGPLAVTVGETTYTANICYENTVPHLIRGQVEALADQGTEPQVLINLTNDGWFWGSSELDMHLACAVFRAVECRKPFLIAANTGFSAWIDSNGQILAQGRRRATDVLIADVAIDTRRSLYLSSGDWPAAICLLVCVGLLVFGGQQRFVHRGAGSRD